MAGTGRSALAIIAIVVLGIGAWLYHLLGWVAAPPQEDTGLRITFDVSPTGDRVVFSATDGDLYLLELATHQVERLTQTPALEGTPVFSPDGRSIAYSVATGAESSGLILGDLQSGKIRQLTDGGGGADGMPGFAPDGKSLVFVRSAKRHLDTGGFQWEAKLYVTGRDSNQPPRLLSTRPHSFIQYPRFDRGGRSIVYTAADRLSKGELYRQLLQPGSTPQEIGGAAPSGYRGGAWASEAQLSHDGRDLAFISDRDRAYRYQVILMRADGTGARTLDLTGVSPYNRQPVPYGQGVFFLGLNGSPGQPSSFSLCRVDRDGTNATVVADGGLFTDPLAWAQKGQPK